ncbi:MAG: sugar ABC transporter permease [Anaerolineaceae bacterium]|nr:sugar ABC transporter permease [Anaerolineaceae bacterium]
MSTLFSDFSLKNFKFKRTERLTKLAKREARWGLFFLSPWLIGFLFLTLLPMVMSLYYSFTNYDLLHPNDIQWIGLKNYIQFFKDPIIRTSALVSLKFAILALPVGIIQPIIMGAVLNSRHLMGKRLFTTLFYMPSIVPLVSAIYIWQGMLNARLGWINVFLERFGIPGPDWLNDTTYIYPALIIIGLWGVGDMLLFHLAAMQGIPTELYEAARVDGAGWLTTFRHITIPMITPIIFYNLILSFIGIFEYFIIPFVLTGGTGRPGDTTKFFAMQLYKEAFAYHNMGYASTMAWMLFVVVMIITIVLFSTAKFWVYSAAGEEK